MTNKASALTSLIAIVGLAISVNVSAAIIKGDFLTASDLPYHNGFPDGPLLYGRKAALWGQGLS